MKYYWTASITSLVLALSGSMICAQTALPEASIIGEWVVDSVSAVNRGDITVGRMETAHLIGQRYRFLASNTFTVRPPGGDGGESMGEYRLYSEEGKQHIGLQNKLMGISTKAELLALEEKRLSFRIEQGKLTFDFFLHRHE